MKYIYYFYNLKKISNLIINYNITGNNTINIIHTITINNIHALSISIIILNIIYLN